jgi:hypothetical protein
MPEIVMEALVLFVTVTVLAALVVLMPSFPNERPVAGDNAT